MKIYQQGICKKCGVENLEFGRLFFCDARCHNSYLNDLFKKNLAICLSCGHEFKDMKIKKFYGGHSLKQFNCPNCGEIMVGKHTAFGGLENCPYCVKEEVKEICPTK